MRPWEKTEQENKLIKLIMSMCSDCLMGCGVDKPTFVQNLRLMAGYLETKAPKAQP